MKKREDTNRPHLAKFERRNRKRRQRRMIIMLTLSFMVFIVLGTVLTVKSQSSGHVEISDSAYRDLEKNYIKEVRQMLSEEGFDNSGVTLTKEYKEDGTRNYDVLIHHKRITALSQEEQEALRDEISQIPFPVPGCGFEYRFLARG